MAAEFVNLLIPAIMGVAFVNLLVLAVMEAESVNQPIQVIMGAEFVNLMGVKEATLLTTVALVMEIVATGARILKVNTTAARMVMTA